MDKKEWVKWFAAAEMVFNRKGPRQALAISRKMWMDLDKLWPLVEKEEESKPKTVTKVATGRARTIAHSPPS